MRRVRRPARSLALATSLLAGTLAPSAGATHLAPGALAEAAHRVGFHVGAAIDHDLDAARREIAAREFTSATLENSLKWGPLSPAPGVYDFSRADAVIDWAEPSGLRVRGHTLFWDRLNGTPGWLADEVAAAPDPAAHLRQRMETHAQTVVGRYAGRLSQWDVVNEPLAALRGDLDPLNLFVQTLGESYLDIAFRAAHAADPDAELFLNETLVELLPAKFEGLIALVERMLARGVPIHGVGLQGHFLLAPPDPFALRSQLERIAALGLRVELTEVDIPISLFASAPDPLAAQAQAYGDLFEACVSVRACTGITTWGVDDGHTWLDSFFLTQQNAPNRPLLFDASGQPKPAYDAAVAALALRIIDVDVDVAPGDPGYRINPSSRGVVAVAILGADGFDVFDIVPATLGFGPAGAPLAHAHGPHYEDVNEDGRTDLLAHYRTQQTGLSAGDPDACVSGRTVDGLAFAGCDRGSVVERSTASP
ncbi:MAG: endo-1,4-beta-xylanase [Deltaproteobacteria bacterium]|nr:MAG: endo-1,4-beta-xylanase [Deltaproteobacteria bacterium]